MKFLFFLKKNNNKRAPQKKKKERVENVAKNKETMLSFSLFFGVLLFFVLRLILKGECATSVLGSLLCFKGGLCSVLYVMILIVGTTIVLLAEYIYMVDLFVSKKVEIM